MGLSLSTPQQVNHSMDLLVPIFRQGKLIYQSPSTRDIREFCIKQVAEFEKAGRKTYSIKIDPKLEKIKKDFLKKSKSK